METTIEERINNIEKRLIRLEKIEKRRQILGIVRLVITIVIVIMIVVSVYFMLNRINEIISPFQEINESYNSDKINDILNDFLSR